ncbi:MAG: hypothetical protein AAGE94_19310 [Acidobacteriota bacterium]
MTTGTSCRRSRLGVGFVAVVALAMSSGFLTASILLGMGLELPMLSAHVETHHPAVGDAGSVRLTAWIVVVTFGAPPLLLGSFLWLTLHHLARDERAFREEQQRWRRAERQPDWSNLPSPRRDATSRQGAGSRKMSRSPRR